MKTNRTGTTFRFIPRRWFLKKKFIFLWVVDANIAFESFQIYRTKSGNETFCLSQIDKENFSHCRKRTLHMNNLRARVILCLSFFFFRMRRLMR